MRYLATTIVVLALVLVVGDPLWGADTTDPATAASTGQNGNTRTQAGDGSQQTTISNDGQTGGAKQAADGNDKSGDKSKGKGKNKDKTKQRLLDHSGITAHNATSEAGEGVGDDEDMARVGFAVLRPTDGHKVHGTARFDLRGGKVVYVVRGWQLAAGRHAVHIQLYGDCSAPNAISAGPNYNLRGRSTFPPRRLNRITGNLGNLNIDANGAGETRGVLDYGGLNGDKSIIGRAVAIYANANNPKKPPQGGAGARVACGVIGIANPAKPAAKPGK